MFFRLVSVLVVALSLAACAQSQPRGQGGKMISADILEGSVRAPEFPQDLAWLNTSAPLRLQDLRGKFVLLDFWTFCCINCMHIMPDLRQLETKYSQELVVIGVHSAKFRNEKDTSQIRDAILRYEIHHPVVNDADFEIWRAYAISSWPTVVLINPLGNIVGERPGEGVFAPIDKLLSEGVTYFQAKGQLKRSPVQFALEEARRANTLLAFPGKISADEKGNRLFITDSNHDRVLITDAGGKVLDAIGSGGEGRKDGGFEEAEFHHPQGTFLAGNILYIADTENHLVRAADLAARTVKTVLGTGEQSTGQVMTGKGVAVALSSPWDLLVLGGKMYIAMAGFHQIWVSYTQTWEVRPWA